MLEKLKIDAKIDWYDSYFLDYNEEQLFNAIHALELKVGDKIRIAIEKVEQHKDSERYESTI